MIMPRTLVVFILSLFITKTLQFGGNKLKQWDGLKVTWTANPLDKYGFDSLPRTLDDAISQNWKMVDEQCSEKSKPFRGYRYMLNNDPAVVLIFAGGSNGKAFIAGIQTVINSADAPNFQPSLQLKNHPYVQSRNMWTLTAYFVDPATICNPGRTEQHFSEFGTGNGLWIQNGTDPEGNLAYIPLFESDIKNSMWNGGKCFKTMGNHYWFNVRKDMSCDEFFPVFVLYNDNQLNSFGFAFNAKMSSPRYEKVTDQVLSHFIDPLPDCFSNDPNYKNLSPIHIYMTDNPRANRC